ncbi:MAG: chemotaxis protein CheW [Pseudomonadota bacterium]
MSSLRPGEPSSVDMRQFYQVFFEEAQEHLTEMESLLLSIDPAAATTEELNAIFRAAHSIKGSSGTFGFTDMTEVTHELESLLDKVRKGEFTLTHEMVDALLAAGDVLRAQLAYHRGDSGEVPDTSAICERIRALLQAQTAQHAPATERVRELLVSFPVLETVDDAALAEVLDMLGALGTVIGTPTQDDGPMRRLRFRTAAAEKQIRNLFALICDPDAVLIEPVQEDAADGSYGFFDAVPASAAEGEAAYGFFDDAPGTPAAKAVEGQDYGFFTDVAGATEAPAAEEAPAPQPPAPEAAPGPMPYGRRATDLPDADGMRAGRRETDKIVYSAAAEAASIRVSVEKVDQLINQVGELVITQAMLAQAVSQLDPVAHQALFNGLADLERNTRDLQESVMSIRMMPIGFVFKRFPRMVRDLAAKLGKQVQLHMEGEATELDRGLIEKIADPLTHLIRNSVDHGIEAPEQRIAAGKPAHGSITLRAAHQGGGILIEVIDDGKGLDRNKILARARERGLPANDHMSDNEVWQLIFEPGFSTADTITDISGRGVGMDVVKRNITELGGSVDIESAPGYGTRVTVRLPLTLAIIDGMSVAVGEDIYIIPLAMVVETLPLSNRTVRSVAGGGHVVEVRDEYLPLVSLRDLFPGSTRGPEADEGIMLVVESEGIKNAFLVDELLGQQQVVVKSLEANYRKVPGISGATILGNGQVALILDVPSLVRMSRH